MKVIKKFNPETSEEEISKFWDEYYADEKYRKIPGYLGVCAQEKTGCDEFKYGIGCKATDVDGVPDGFEVIHIPEYEWAVFKCVGPTPKAIQDMWEKIFKEAIQKLLEFREELFQQIERHEIRFNFGYFMDDRPGRR